MVSVGHIALFVHNLREAEAFYRHLFNMELLMRETKGENSLWYTLPMDKSWDDAIAAGIDLKMVALKRENFILPLFQGSPAPKDTVLEIGVVMNAEQATALRNRLPDTVTLAHHPNDLMFATPSATAGTSGRWTRSSKATAKEPVVGLRFNHAKPPVEILIPMDL